MFKSDANDKETKDDSRMKSLGGDKVNLGDWPFLKQSVGPACGDCG